MFEAPHTGLSRRIPISHAAYRSFTPHTDLSPSGFHTESRDAVWGPSDGQRVGGGHGAAVGGEGGGGGGGGRAEGGGEVGGSSGEGGQGGGNGDGGSALAAAAAAARFYRRRVVVGGSGAGESEEARELLACEVWPRGKALGAGCARVVGMAVVFLICQRCK